MLEPEFRGASDASPSGCEESSDSELISAVDVVAPSVEEETGTVGSILDGRGIMAESLFLTEPRSRNGEEEG